jgi:hypothetical protein
LTEFTVTYKHEGGAIIYARHLADSADVVYEAYRRNYPPGYDRRSAIHVAPTDQLTGGLRATVEASTQVRPLPGSDAPDHLLAQSEMMDSYFGGEVIHAYTRGQALTDSALVDVTEIAREAGFTAPVAVTRAVWERHIAWTDEDRARKRGRAFCDQEGRKWDCVWMAAQAMRRHRGEPSCYFRLLSHVREGRAYAPREVTLFLQFGGGDNGEPVATICLQDVSDH